MNLRDPSSAHLPHFSCSFPFLANTYHFKILGAHCGVSLPTQPYTKVHIHALNTHLYADNHRHLCMKY